MDGRTSILVKNTIILGLGQFIPKFIILVTLPILTLALNSSNYGMLDLILSMQNLLMPLMTLQIQQGVFRKLIENKIGHKKDIISNGFSFWLISFFCWFILIFIITNFFLKYSIIMTSTIALYYLSYSGFDVLGQIVRGIGDNLKYSIGIIIYSILYVTTLGIQFSLNNICVETALISSLLAYVISSLYYIVSCKLYKEIDIKKFKIKIFGELLKYSMPIIPSSISLWIVNLSDRLLITFFLGISMNGVYSVANKIPSLFASVYAVFNLAWTENAARVMDNDSDVDEYYSKMFNFLFKFLTGAMLILISISPILFQILINKQYEEAYSQMPILFIGVFLNCIVSFYGGIYVAKQVTSKVGISSFIGAALNFLINFIMIRDYGLYAASVSTVLSFGIIALYRAIDLKQYVKIKYNIKMILFCLVSMVTYSVACSKKNIYICGVFLMAGIMWNIVLNRDILKYIFKKR